MFKKKPLHLYNSLDTLKILTFWSVLKDKNAMLIDFDYYDGKKYNEKQLHEIETTWSRLYDEYFILRKNTKAVADLQKGFDKLKISSDIVTIKQNYDFLLRLKGFQIDLPQEDFLRHEQNRYAKLKESFPFIKFKLFEGINYNLEVLQKVLNAMQNTYNLHHKKLEKKIDHEIKEVHNIYSDVTNMEGWLDKDTIPIEDVVCSKWLAYEVMRDTKIKNSKKDGK